MDCKEDELWVLRADKIQVQIHSVRECAPVELSLRPDHLAFVSTGHVIGPALKRTA